MSAFRELEDALSTFSTFPLVHGPTPLEELKLNKEILSGHDLLAKRDDCTGLAFGGNKTRKLEFTIGHALAKGYDTVLTASGIQSNMVRQTAAAATKAGLEFHTIVAPALENFPKAHLESGNVLLDCLFGTNIHMILSEDDFDAELEKLHKELQDQGKNPYLIPLGASDGLGSLGYIKCAMELLTQFEKLEKQPARIFLPTGSGGTHGGLLAGLRYLGSTIDVIGISVSDETSIKLEKVTNAIKDIEKVLGRPLPSSIYDEICVYDDYIGAGYSHPTDEANEALKLLAKTDGLLLDPVYTAKCFAGLLDLLSNFDPNDGPSVFLHTGGTPVLFAGPSGIMSLEENAQALLPLLDRTI